MSETAEPPKTSGRAHGEYDRAWLDGHIALGHVRTRTSTPVLTDHPSKRRSPVAVHSHALARVAGAVLKQVYRDSPIGTARLASGLRCGDAGSQSDLRRLLGGAA